MRRFLVVVLTMAILSVSAYAQSVRFGTEAAYAPWSFVDVNGEVAGFEADLVMEICTRRSLDCTLVLNPWDTIIPNLVEGKYDAIIAAMTITLERKKLIDFSAEYYPPHPSRFAMTSAAEVDLDTPNEWVIGAQVGTIQAAYALENLATHNTVLTFETADAAIAGLYNGAVDAVLAGQSYLEPIIAGSNGVLKIHGPMLSIGAGIGIGVSKNNPDLRNALNSALSSLKADGTLDALIKKWFGAGPFYTNCSALLC